jgi:drug/metabolite transporter (DMT)-like permease
MEANARSDTARALRERIRQLKLFFCLWLLVALLYGTMFVLTLVLHGEFNGLWFAVTLAMTGAAVLDVIWIRAARRQLRAIESA